MVTKERRKTMVVKETDARAKTITRMMFSLFRIIIIMIGIFRMIIIIIRIIQDDYDDK